MPNVPQGVDRREITVVARRVLLDAVEALGPQAAAIVLIGAQAVYLRTESAAVTGAVYTSDADLGIDPAKVADSPEIFAALTAAGFSLAKQDNPGVWASRQTIGGQERDVCVDLLVPRGIPGPRIGRRSAEIPPHDKKAMRWVPGIDVALVDNSPLVIGSLEPETDTRQVEISVAGPTALLIAKAYKIRDRLRDADGGRLDRLSDKDASDVVRLMMTTRPDTVAEALARVGADPRVADVAAQGHALLHELFSGPKSPGIAMALRALEGDLDPGFVVDLCEVFLDNVDEHAGT